jgi:hypothetical protein
MKIKLSFISLLLLLTLPAWAISSESEINHLLNFIEQSGCQFDRNGSVHDSKEAREHIQMKYDYARKWISSTEDFIEYTATKSSMTGKRYHVVCAGKRIPSGEWLLNELKHYRSNPSE